MKRFHDLNFQMAQFKRLIEGFSKEDREKIIAALDLSFSQHAHQKRKNGAAYVVHPIRVANVLLRETKKREADLVCAALLHDTIEDTGLDLSAVQSQFGERVAYLVGQLSRLANEGKETYLERVIGADEAVTLLKLCDRLDNCRDLVEISSNQTDFARRQIREVEEYYLPFTSQFEPYFDEQLHHNVNLARQKLDQAKV